MAGCDAVSNDFGKFTVTVVATAAYLPRTMQTPVRLSKITAATGLC